MLQFEPADLSAAAPGDGGPAFAWFCLRSQPRHEHIAAAHLRQIENVEVVNPRIRFARATRQGPVWVTESLFPNYLFARFDWQTLLNRIHFAPGIRGIVHFGSRWPTIPGAVIDELRQTLGEDEVHVIPDAMQPGDEVEIAGGAFHGLRAVVTKVMPGRERVAVLLDFLGRQTTVELRAGDIVKAGLRF